MNTIQANAHKLTILLANRAVSHGLIKEDPFMKQQQKVYIINYMHKNQYLAITFHGIIPDSSAISVSTAGHPQF